MSFGNVGVNSRGTQKSFLQIFYYAYKPKEIVCKRKKEDKSSFPKCIKFYQRLSDPYPHTMMDGPEGSKWH